MYKRQRYLDPSEVSICVDSPAQVHKLDRLYTWPAAATVNGTCPPPFVCRHIISVLASDTVSPNAVHAVMMTVNIFSNLSVIAIQCLHRQRTRLCQDRNRSYFRVSVEQKILQLLLLTHRYGIKNSRVKSGYLRTGAKVRALFARAKASRFAGPNAMLKAVF